MKGSDLAAWVAAVAALVAVFVSVRQQQEAHRRALVKDRLVEATALLAAFEELATIVSADNMRTLLSNDSVPTERDGARDRAAAVYSARLYGSSEALPINRGTAFGHWNYGAVDPAEKAHLAQAPLLGNPETDSDMTCYQRAELVEAVAGLRRVLDRRYVRRRDIPLTVELKAVSPMMWRNHER